MKKIVFNSNRSSLRPIIFNNKTGLFHEWVVLNNIVMALVELNDGNMDLVEYNKVTFIDGQPKLLRVGGEINRGLNLFFNGSLGNAIAKFKSLLKKHQTKSITKQ